MFRSAASALRLPGVDPSTKLALVERLLAETDRDTSVRLAVEWLSAHGGPRRALVAIADRITERLHVVADAEVKPTALEPLSFDSPEPHALAAALHRRDATYFDGQSPGGPDLFDGAAFHAIPLRSESGAAPLGLLLATASGPTPQSGTDWLARTLATQLARLAGLRSQADLRSGREQRLLFTIINAVTDPIVLTDADGRITIANTHAEKLFVAPDGASEGWRRATALNNMLFSAALSTSTVSESDLSRRELLLVDPHEGSDLLFELLSSRASDDQQGAYVVSILRNVTDLARAKKEIEESYRTLRVAQAEVRDERHRLDLIIDSVADPILVTDQEGDIVLMNEPAERLFSAPIEGGDATARRVRANGAHLTSFVSNVLTSPADERHRGEIQLADPVTGRPSPVEGLAGQILSEQGELMWVVTILHDLTETLDRAHLIEQLKHVSQDLERRVQEATAELAAQNELLRRQHIALEQASALKSQFLANMSHEFRTPLNAIMGYTHMLLTGVSGPISEAQRKSVTRIDSNSRHLLALISDILDITRIEAGRMPLNVSGFRVPVLVDEVMSELEPIIKRSNLTVTARMTGRLPEIWSDRQKVKQIVLNLLSNALKFTTDGSVTITAHLDAPNRAVVVSVEDTGVGIAEADQAKVFEDFRQLDGSPARGYGGTGLGLAICRRLSQMLGGTIDLQSAAHQGSTFTLRLPVRPKSR